MNFSKIVYLSRKLAQQLKPDTSSCLISFHSPNEDKPYFSQAQFESKTHWVECENVLYKNEGAMFTEEMGAELALFLKNMDQQHIKTVYVCCEYGEIRSASCALCLSDYFNVDLYENTRKFTDQDPRIAGATRIYDYTYMGLELLD